MNLQIMQDEAVRQFLLQSSIPIVVEQPGNSPAILGNGTLFAINGRSYLTTARHVVQNVDFNTVGVVASRDPTASAWTLRGSCLYTPQDPGYDIALIELRDEELLWTLRSGWRFLGPSNIGTIGRSELLMAGYPDSLRRGNSQQQSLGFIGVRTIRRDDYFRSEDVSRDQVVPGRDVFFDYEKEGMTSSGHIVQMPELRGISGASIWSFTPTEGAGVWSAERQMKVVAIEVGYLRDTYIRAQNWAVVCEALHQVDPAGAAQVYRAARKSDPIAPNAASAAQKRPPNWKGR